MARVESVDTTSLSFIDVLTCVLGGAIMLFLVFVSMVSLVATEGDIEAESVGISRQKVRSIQAEINEGFATSTVMLMSDNKAIANALETQVLNNARVTATDPITGKILKRYDGKTYHGTRLTFYKNLPQFSPTISLAEVGSGTSDVIGFVSVGGVTNCVKIKVSKSKVRRYGHYPILEFGPLEDLYLDTRYGGLPCP